MKKEPLIIDVPLDKNKTREFKLGPTIIRGAAAPLDFPAKIKIEIDDEISSATVDFIYSMSLGEHLKKIETDGITWHLGVQSGRVFRLEIPLPQPPKRQHFSIAIAPPVRKQLKRLKGDAEMLPSSSRPIRRIAHYEILKDLMPFIFSRAQERWGTQLSGAH